MANKKKADASDIVVVEKSKDNGGRALTPEETVHRQYGGLVDPTKNGTNAENSIGVQNGEQARTERIKENGGYGSAEAEEEREPSEPTDVDIAANVAKLTDGGTPMVQPTMPLVEPGTADAVRERIVAERNGSDEPKKAKTEKDA